MRNRFIIVAASLIAAPAYASPPQEWRQLQQRAERSCIAASNFQRPRVSSMIVFDDVAGVVALLVTGTFRGRHVRGATGTNLCLYNRRTGTAAVGEAVGWGERR
jgi:hypothetical protein